MKNLKNLVTMGILMGGLMASSTFAATGLMMSDAPDTISQHQCTEDSLDSNYAGIIVMSIAETIESNYTGIIVMSASEEGSNCKNKSANGLMISD